jgi:hypothetical protein
MDEVERMIDNARDAAEYAQATTPGSMAPRYHLKRFCWFRFRRHRWLRHVGKTSKNCGTCQHLVEEALPPIVHAPNIHQNYRECIDCGHIASL